MDTGRELEEAMRELEGKLRELRHLMADARLPFGVYEEAESWSKNLLQSVRLTDSLASELRRVLLGESRQKPATFGETPFITVQLQPPSVQTEMEAELERVFGAESTAPPAEDWTAEVAEQQEQIVEAEDKELEHRLEEQWLTREAVQEGFTTADRFWSLNFRARRYPELQASLDSLRALWELKSDLERQLKSAELALSSVVADGRTTDINELTKIRPALLTINGRVEKALDELERQLEFWEKKSEDDGPIGGALVGARPRPKPPTLVPSNARTVEEAETAPRNP